MKPTKIAVIGIGRVGLPLALVFAKAGYRVFGVDTNLELIRQLMKGRLPFRETGAQELLNQQINKNFIPTADGSIVSKCQYIILTLGTPVDENMNPSLVQIEAALRAIKPYLKPKQVLILRSTVSPGTTEYVAHLLGKKIYLAFCPERIAEGKAIEELYQIPQIIGGVNKISSQKAAGLFKALKIKCWLTDPVSAELAKLFTNMYRYINFAIANEFMILADKYHRDIYEIVNLVNRDYKRGGLSLPGLTGGACLFKDGFFLINDIPFADLISTSWKINESIPLFFINCINQKMSLTGKKAIILGAAFKANIDDYRESLSFKVKKALERTGAQVILHDPLIAEFNTDLNSALSGASLIFIATKHDYYLKNVSREKIKKLAKPNCLICDVWNIFGTNKIIFPA
jgi:UDP-N-acetyl-D-mannosaminuronic acid dehydrogenase